MDVSRTITIDPVSRISGFLEIKAEEENGIIKNASTSGLLYRGFEKMLKGRAPLDAIYFTERICGICSTSHSIASSLALEDALKIGVDINDRYIRDIMHGFEFISNHLRHFYLFVVPDYVRLPNIRPIYPQEIRDFRIPGGFEKKIGEHYIQAIELSRLAHEGLSELGGKAPHNHGVFAGGVTVNIDSYKIIKVKSIISKLKEFIIGLMFEDMNIIAQFYPDYFKNGISYPYYMSYGLFDYNESDISFIKPGVSIDGINHPLNTGEIAENIQFSWYTDTTNLQKPGTEYRDDINLNKKDGYTFIKAGRYAELPMETGPLARLIINGEYKGGNSTMDRNIARVVETKKIIGIMENIIKRIELKPANQRVYEMPEEANGAGLVDTVRGALGHWIRIKNKVIQNYDIITPSVWNFSPIDTRGIHGTAEKALIGTRIANTDHPVELGRIVRSFDPCISCATHFYSPGKEPVEIRML